MDLFTSNDSFSFQEDLAPGAIVLRSFCSRQSNQLLEDIEQVSSISPWRHMSTPGGRPMSVAMTNCGRFGWVSDARGYRYESVDPLTGNNWPQMPRAFIEIAHSAADSAGYKNFDPDCLINRYGQGAKMTLHQDRDEKDMTQPIVSISLGVPATFQFGGLERSSPNKKVALGHGDIVVWGGPSRLYFHGILPLKPNLHQLTEQYRYNLTFRRAM